MVSRKCAAFLTQLSETFLMKWSRDAARECRRDVISRRLEPESPLPLINLPNLIISGRASAIPWKSQEWIHRQIKGSQFEVFESSACLPPQLWWRELPLAERTGLLSS
jgi:pimeloyl-ACP methyl ester carboxylesterase